MIQHRASLLLLILGFLFAGLVRIDHLSFAQVYSDSLSPFAAAVKAMNTGWSNPPNPESDHWLWIFSFPMVLFSQSLEGLLGMRFWVGALVVPLAGLILLVSDIRNVFWALLLVIVLLSFDSGLIDTLLSAFRGYMAPEFFALATVGFIVTEKKQWWGTSLASVSTIMAAGHHPLALGCFVAVAWLFWRTATHSKKWFLIAVVLSFLALLPRMIWLYQLLQCDQGGLACLQMVALSSSEQIGVNVFWSILHDRFWVEMGLGGGILLLGCFLNRKHPLAIWVLLSALGITLLGVTISTLRPYHFRILAVPMICWSLGGWMKRPNLLIGVVPFWFWGVIIQSPDPMEIRNNLVEHDRLAERLCALEHPFWLDGYQPGAEMDLSLQGIGISMALQDCGDRFVPSPKNNLLLLTMVELPYQRIIHEDVYSIYQIDEEELRSLKQESLLSGFDIATLFYRDEEIKLRW